MKLQDGEQKVKRSNATYITGRLKVAPGALILTDRRVAFEQRSRFVTAFGLLGYLVLGSLLPRKIVVNLPLSQIASFARGQYGRNRNVVAILARDGSQYQFGATFDDWAPLLIRAGIPQAQPVPVQAHL
jgi:hypothetical protein